MRMRRDHVATAAIVRPPGRRERTGDIRGIDLPATHTVEVRIEDSVVDKVQFNAESSPQLDG